MPGDSHHTNLSNLLRSPTIEILVGPDRESFYVYPAALQSSESASLRVLISEKWNKSGNPIDWTQWDCQTIESVVNWLYTKTYHIPSPKLHNFATIDPALPEKSLNQEAEDPHATRSVQVGLANSEVPEVVRDVAADGHSSSSAHEQNHSNTEDDTEDPNVQGILWDSYTSQSQKSPDHKVDLDLDICGSCHPLSDSVKTAFPSSTHTYSESLMALARLHHFATYHLCDSLQTTSLRHLHSLLECLDCSQSHTVEDLMKLIEYVYNNISAETPTSKAIREMLSDFTVLHYMHLMHDGFDKVMYAEVEFAIDVAHKVGRKLDLTSALLRRFEEDNADLKSQLTEAKAENKRQEVEYKTRTENCKKCRNSWNGSFSGFGVSDHGRVGQWSG